MADDLRLTLNIDAIDNLAKAIRARYKDRLSVEVTLEDSSPWIHIKVQRIDPHDAQERHSWNLSLWRATDDIYEFDPDIPGAVKDDPIADFAEILE